MPPITLELTLFGSRISEDGIGFICLNDLWAAAGSPSKLKIFNWQRNIRARALTHALSREIARIPSNLPNLTIKSVIYSTGRGRGARAYAHAILALDYTEWLNPDLGVAMRRVFLRYRANDLTLAQEMMDRIKAQLAEDTRRLENREEFTARYREFRGRAQRAGCQEPRDYTYVNSGGYGGFYGDMPLPDVRTRKDLPEGAPLPGSVSV